MSDIQKISIISTQTVELPKPHITYTIQISTPTRTWTVNRRYNDFVSLNAELISTTKKEPPGKLPAKHWSLTRSLGDEKTIRERRILLEQYLRAILSTKDSSFRSAYTFTDFLAVPSSTTSTSTSNSSAGTGGGGVLTFTPQSWLIEQSSIQGQLRSARSALLKRDALANMGDTSNSRSSAVEAKRILKDVDARLNVLESGLAKFNTGVIGDGERKRRQDMIDGLRVERSNLGRMVDAGVRAQLPLPSTSLSSSSSNSSGQNGISMPGAFIAQAQTGRVFGTRAAAAPVETTETRPLDERGLLQLQVQKMNNQDESLSELSKVLQRQRKMGEEIHQEIEEQNELLDQVESGVDKTGRKLGKAKREMNRLN